MNPDALAKPPASPELESLVLRVQPGTKARWVRQSRAEGKKLTDWVVERVEGRPPQGDEAPPATVRPVK